MKDFGTFYHPAILGAQGRPFPYSAGGLGIQLLPYWSEGRPPWLVFSLGGARVVSLYGLG